MRYPKKADRKAAWLSDFERECNNIKPATTGKIEWDTAIYLFHQGGNPHSAALLYCHRTEAGNV